jgi:hypothetical protein
MFLLRSVVLEGTLPVLRCRVHVRQREDSSGVITLTIISLNGAPVSRAASATFDELGGTIGRADTNQLVLEDPDRSVSRVHAQIVFRSGSYAVVDRGSNPIQVNGRDVGNGREAPLAEGDRLQIGGYVLSVQRALAASSAASDDPFAGLLTPSGGKGPSAPSGARPAPGIPDPLAAFGFDTKPSKAPVSSSRAASPSAPGASIGGIPEDWDPFAPDPLQAGPSAPGRSGSGPRDSLGLDIGGAAPAALIPGSRHPDLGRRLARQPVRLEARFGRGPAGRFRAGQPGREAEHGGQQRSVEVVEHGAEGVGRNDRRRLFRSPSAVRGAAVGRHAQAGCADRACGHRASGRRAASSVRSRGGDVLGRPRQRRPHRHPSFARSAEPPAPRRSAGRADRSGAPSCQ